jgi:hypothetical protein
MKLTPKAYTNIIQRRCAITTGTSGRETKNARELPEGLEIRVSPVKNLDRDMYYFEISGENVFEFRGRRRREVLWEVRIIVDERLRVKLYTLRELEDVPRDVIECAEAAVSSAEAELG